MNDNGHNPMHEIAEKTDAIRKERNRVVFMFLAFPLYGLAAFSLTSLLNISENYIPWLVAPYAVTYLYLGYRVSNAICPACHGPMFRQSIFYYGFFRCVHCGHQLNPAKRREA